MRRVQNTTDGNSSSSSDSSFTRPRGDIFANPIDSSPPIPAIPTTRNHPVPRLGILKHDKTIAPNKFYANLFLGSQGAGVWTHPYQVSWAKGGGAASSWGMAISHIDADQQVMGPKDDTSQASTYFINPNGLQSMIMSAAELSNSTTLTTTSLTPFSVNVNLCQSNGSNPAISFPLLQGMAFVSGIYNDATPLIQTSIGFFSMIPSPTSPKAGVTKYTFITQDQKKWLLYAHATSGPALDLTLSGGSAKSASKFHGVIQIAKDPGNAETLYDVACGTYPTDAEVCGTVDGPVGSYSLAWSKAGLKSPLLMFALPHHVQSFLPQTTLSVTKTQLMTTTKGVATAVIADSWDLQEPNMPVDLGFAPWTPANGSVDKLSPAAVSAILPVAQSEITQNMTAQCDLNSMYYSGKGLAKFAIIIYTLSELLNDKKTAQTGLDGLKENFALFIANKNQFPLLYESAWGGIVSSASYTTGDPGVDFGNTYYNDHHFHYGYFILAGAIIGHLDPGWLTENNGTNKDYINGLARDIANPNHAVDTYFPFYRMFDWYHGHSWAHGLYETYDGKDQESSSEDSMCAYALKMWGNVIGDKNMEARGNLQLAITARTLQLYFLYEKDNTVEPSGFIGNKVSGILFENKIDHTTYFGSNPEYIQGIHMLPLLAHSTLTRKQSFVSEEWSTWFDNGRADKVVGGWKGVLFANLAIVDPVTSWKFFNDEGFDETTLDGGASRTWYMAWAAALGGA